MTRTTQPSARLGSERAVLRAPSPVWGAVLLALLLIGPALLAPGGLLPNHPAQHAPLAEEDPARAALAASAELRHVGVAPFPLLTDLRVLAEASAGGRVPRWDPGLGLGEPTGASQFPWWYPPYALLAWLPAGRVLALLVGLGLAIAALGLDGLLRERGVSRSSRLVAGIGLVGGGWALWNGAAVSPLHAAAWLPVALWGAERGARGRRFSRSLVALATVGALSAGAPEIGLFTPLVAGLYARLAPRALLAIALGAVLSGPAWVGALEAGDTTPAVNAGSETLPRPVLLTAFAPGAFGLPSDPFEVGRNPAAWWFCPAPSDAQRGAPGQWSVYAGVGVASLAAAGIVGAPLAALAPMVLLAFAMLYAFGVGPGPWLYRFPGLGLGPPERALAVAWIAWPWLAAVGAGALSGPRRRLAALGALSVAFVGGTLGAALARSIDPRPYASGMLERLADWHGEALSGSLFTEDVALAAAARLGSEGEILMIVSGVALASSLFALALRRPRPTLVVLPWLALASGEGLRLGWQTLAGCPVPGATAPSSEFLDALDVAPDGPARVLRFGPNEGAPHQSLVALYGAADLTPWSTRSPDGLAQRLARIQVTTDPPRSNPEPPPPWRAAPARAPELRALEGLGVDWLVGSADADASHLGAPTLVSGELCAWRLTGRAAERCRVVERLSVDELSSSSAPHRPDLERVEVAWTRPTPERFDVTVRGVPEGGAWLVVAEQWHRGWRATVQGEQVPITRADDALRAVRVPAGDSVVRMSFHSRAQDVAVWCAVLAALLALVLTRRRARGEEATA